MGIGAQRSAAQPSRLFGAIDIPILAPGRVILTLVVASTADVSFVHQLDITGPQGMALHVVPVAGVCRLGGLADRLTSAGVECASDGPDIFDDIPFRLDRPSQVPP